MLKLKSEVWTNANGKRFVVVAEEDFARLAELLEDRGLSRILKQAKRADAGKAAIPFAEVKRQLAARRRRQSPA
jgi:PHD/YefM family antitoxin component YafN of YafNO toxin-antitoxin module